MYTSLSALGAIRLTIPAMLIVTLQIPAPVVALVLRTVVGFLACAGIAILIGIALGLAIPAMVFVGLKIPAPILAFIQRTRVLLALFRVIRAATKEGSRNQNRKNAQNAMGRFM